MIQCFNITNHIAIISQLCKRQLNQLMGYFLFVLVLKCSSTLLEKLLNSAINLKNFASRNSVLQLVYVFLTRSVKSKTELFSLTNLLSVFINCL